MSAQTVAAQVAPPALRLLPAPVSEPRSDPAAADAATVTTLGRAAPQAPGPVALFDRGRLAARPRHPVPLSPDDAEAEPPPAPRRTPARELAEPGRWAGQFVQAAVEVAAGLRPPVQLVRWTDEAVYATLARRNEIAGRARRAGRLGGRGRPVVRSVRSRPVIDGVVEASAVVTDGTRYRAVALRLEGLDGRWRVTALELG